MWCHCVDGPQLPSVTTPTFSAPFEMFSSHLQVKEAMVVSKFGLEMGSKQVPHENLLHAITQTARFVKRWNEKHP